MLSSLRGEYEAYVDSFQFYKNPVIQQWVKDRRAEGRLLYREPFMTLAKPFLDGSPLQALIDDGTLHSAVARVFTRVPGDPTAGVVSPFKHQEQAIRQVTGGNNTVVATGTGSGKSFTFYIPIVSAALRSAEGRNERAFRNPLAVIIYPMNALANSQHEDMAARLAGSGLTICNYTGDLKTTSEAALKDFRDLTGRNQPYDSEVIDRGTLHDRGCDILLTNFKMLEYALVRREDAKLFHGLNFGGPLQFLVLDEMHTYSGRQGADMALLVRRFKERTGTTGTLRCIGTSATVDSSDPKQAAIAIAEFASHLFGERFDPVHVVGEQYNKPETLDLDHPSMYLAPQPVPAELVEQARTLTENAAIVSVLAPSLLGQDATEEVVRACQPVAWVERALWSGVRSLHDLVAAYQTEVRSGASADEARAEIEAALMLGAAFQVSGPKGPVGLLTPKAHAFFSQGLPVTGCYVGSSRTCPSRVRRRARRAPARATPASRPTRWCSAPLAAPSSSSRPRTRRSSRHVTSSTWWSQVSPSTS